MTPLVSTSPISRFKIAASNARVAWLASMVAVAAITQTHADITVFSDDMNYIDTAAMSAAWSGGLDATPELFTQLTFDPTPLAAFTPTPASGSVMGLNNGVRYRDFSQTVTTDWSLSFLVLSNSYSRGQSVFILNAAGTQGYGIEFNTALVNQYSGEGFLSIRKFDNSSYSDWGSFGGGNQLAAGIETGHPVMGYAVTNAPDGDQNNATFDTSSWQDMLEVTLTWSSATGELIAYADGVESVSSTDTDFTSFSRVYLRGNTRAYFDNVQVSAVPEPATTAGILGVSCLLLLGIVRRYRRNS